VLDLLQAGVAGNGRDLVRGAPRLGQAARSGLTEAVGAAMSHATAKGLEHRVRISDWSVIIFPRRLWKDSRR
jgi:hypothetical protein